MDIFAHVHTDARVALFCFACHPSAVTAELGRSDRTRRIQKLQLPAVAVVAVRPRPAACAPAGSGPGFGPGFGPDLGPGSGPSARSDKAGRQGRPTGEPHGAARRRPLLPGRCGYVLRAATAKGTTPGLESGPRDQLLGTEQTHGWPLSLRRASRVVPSWWSEALGWDVVIPVRSR